MDKQVAAQQIADKLRQAQQLMDECVRISEESGVGFDLPWGGEGTHQCGMGAYYCPKDDPSAGYYDHEGWNPSAGTC